ncbi:MAG TPA: permease [Symbiobacteriaceae bacterium]|nr:permease [Symbiobacteriaceae bacterium]
MLTGLFAPLWEGLAPSVGPLLTSFFSVLVGALPFMVVAAFASAFLEVFVSRDAIARLVPKNGPLGVLLAPVLGLVIPMCECGIVPVARRMIQKGVPASAAVTFMLANPILNPLALYSTYLAFPNFLKEMVLARAGVGYVVAVIVGLLVHRGFRGAGGTGVLHEAFDPEVAATAEGAHAACDCDHDHHHHHRQSLAQKLQAVLEHAASEFFDVTKYFIMGAGLAAISQALIDRNMLEALGSGKIASVLVMIAFAYVICICSEADAFVAATFASTFTPGALLGFLVAGPMTDIKNTMMMLSAFRRPFVIFLNVVVIGLTALIAIGLNYTLWGG